LHSTITVHGSQKEASNIERAIYKSQCNINFVESAKSNEPEPPDMPKGKTDLKDQEETKSVPLENAVLDRNVTIRGNLSKEEQAKLIETLAKNKDVFAWSTSDLKGVTRDIIQHSLDINPRIKPKKAATKENVEGENFSSKSQSSKVVKCKRHQRGQILRMASELVLVPKKNGRCECA